MNSPTRPTIADILRETPLAEYPQNPFCQSVGHHPLILEDLANFIAELEWAYPGAVYMPLGRDIVLVGDGIDAFYQMHGQTGRVQRLNASGQSLRGSEPLIARWLQSSGVDFESLAASSGYVFFDQSSYALPNGSQSTRILQSLTEAYVKWGGKAEDLAAKFAFINTYFADSTRGVPMQPGVDRVGFINERREELKSGLVPQKSFAASTRVHGGSEWHSNFLALQEQPDGSVTAPAPPPFGLNVRRDILCVMRDILDQTSRPEFLEMVRKRAAEFGYEFSFERRADCAKELANAG